jgi:integrase
LNNSISNNNVLISCAFVDFLTIHRPHWKSIGGLEKSYRQSFFPLLIGVTGDIKTNQITKAHINDLVKILLVYPANKNKIEKYKNYTVLDFLNIKVNEEDRQKPYTTRKYKTQIGMFLRWLRTNDYTYIDLDAPLKSVRIIKTVAADDKSEFTASDIRKIFNSKDYTKGLHKTASRFWVPLLGLYTGARLNEICQLAKSDVYIEDATKRWVISFNENDDVHNKSIKKPHHSRIVPIHEKLISLGFVDYVELITKKNTMIFPELKYTRDENKYANEIQRWFNRTYLNKSNCNVTTKNTSFHSIRHTVINHLSTVHDLHENKVAKGLGQLPAGGVFENRYSKQNSYSAYAKYFDLINFDTCYDSKKIMHWKKQVFFKSLK